METVPLRSLVTHLKVISDQVEAGETVLVTNRGRPIAVLTPIDEERLEEWLKGQSESTASAKAADKVRT